MRQRNERERVARTEFGVTLRTAADWPASNRDCKRLAPNRRAPLMPARNAEAMIARPLWKLVSTCPRRKRACTEPSCWPTWPRHRMAAIDMRAIRKRWRPGGAAAGSGWSNVQVRAHCSISSYLCRGSARSAPEAYNASMDLSAGAGRPAMRHRAPARLRVFKHVGRMECSGCTRVTGRPCRDGHLTRTRPRLRVDRGIASSVGIRKKRIENTRGGLALRSRSVRKCAKPGANPKN